MNKSVKLISILSGVVSYVTGLANATGIDLLILGFDLKDLFHFHFIIFAVCMVWVILSIGMETLKGPYK